MGSGDFVSNVMKDANEALDQTAKFDISLDELISRVEALPQSSEGSGMLFGGG
ncbi:MAG: hypothetical protein JRE61_08655 [Deltaproteobacteria bacterium]|nr:hypothetical protein [Deltaproteobacteria bacterium]